MKMEHRPIRARRNADRHQISRPCRDSRSAASAQSAPRRARLHRHAWIEPCTTFEDLHTKRVFLERIVLASQRVPNDVLQEPAQARTGLQGVARKKSRARLQ